MFPETATRVEKHTASHLNRRFRQDFDKEVAYYKRQPPEYIGERLHELNQEWDVERTLQTNFAVLSIVGALLTSTQDKRWATLAVGVPALQLLARITLPPPARISGAGAACCRDPAPRSAARSPARDRRPLPRPCRPPRPALRAPGWSGPAQPRWQRHAAAG